MDSLTQELFLSGYPSSFYWLYPCILWSQLSLLKCTAVSWAHLYYLIWGTCLKIYCICLHLFSFYRSNQFLSRFWALWKGLSGSTLSSPLFIPNSPFLLTCPYFYACVFRVVVFFHYKQTWPFYLFLLYT